KERFSLISSILKDLWHSPSPFFDFLDFSETWTKRQLATLNPVRQLFHPEIIRLTLLMLAN
ncbi:MAG: hypothetical protein ABF481_04085, partial [Liquorilactobacillus satsumensis]